MAELSIFVDESGNFGLPDKRTPLYIVAMVFHNQENDISAEIEKLNRSLEKYNCSGQAVHTGPLIRREEPYQFLSPNERRGIFSRLFFFALNTNIKFKTFVFKKSDYSDIFKLEAKMAREISGFVRENLSFFQNFDNVILYYDNGQHELNRILNTVLASELSEYDVRKVFPSDYRLFQVADLVCTLELLLQKINSGKELSKSETLIFHSKRDLKKDFLKGIAKKMM